MDELFENYDGDGSSFSASTTRWLAQTFTPAVPHTVTRVQVKVYRNTASYLGAKTIVSIKATDGDGKPTGADLSDAPGIPTTNLPNGSPSATFVEWDFTTEPDLDAGTLYAIVLRTDVFDFRLPFWRIDTTGSYAAGRYWFSSNSGSTWGDGFGPNDDAGFKVFGVELPSGVPSGSGPATAKLLLGM